MPRKADIEGIENSCRFLLFTYQKVPSCGSRGLRNVTKVLKLFVTDVCLEVVRLLYWSHHDNIWLDETCFPVRLWFDLLRRRIEWRSLGTCLHQSKRRIEKLVLCEILQPFTTGLLHRKDIVHGFVLGPPLCSWTMWKLQEKSVEMGC